MIGSRNRFLFYFFFLFFNLTSTLAVQIKNEKTISIEYKTFYHNIEKGYWGELRYYFDTLSNYKSFVSHFSKSPNNTDDFRAYYSYQLLECNGNKAVFVNQTTQVKYYLTVRLSIKNGFSKVEKFRIKKSKEVKEILKDTLTYDYVRLPLNGHHYAKRYNSFKEAFNDNVETDFYDRSTDTVFRAIPFPAITLKEYGCNQGVFSGSTQDKTKEIGYVLDEKDDPVNKDSLVNINFGDIVDMESYRSETISSNNENHNGYTTVMLDEIKKVLIVLQEGICPVYYGGKEGEIKFSHPLALKEINGFLYVLDKKEDSSAFIIHILKVEELILNNRMSFNVRVVGEITKKYLKETNWLETPKDISGYVMPDPNSPNGLLFLDGFGIHVIALDKKSGLPIEEVYYLTSVTDKKADRFDWVRMLDARKIEVRSPENTSDLGTILVLMRDKEVVAFSIAAILRSKIEADILVSHRMFLIGKCGNEFEGASYMHNEQCWYMFGCDLIYKLNKNGLFVEGGTYFDPELKTYSPIITSLVSSPYFNPKYKSSQYLISNINSKLGFTLHTPGYLISKIKVFENLHTGVLDFGFITSGKWQEVNGVNAIRIKSIAINGKEVASSHWNDQINDRLVSDQSKDFLTKFPEQFHLSPFSTIDSKGNSMVFKRGWNTISVQVALYNDSIGLNEKEVIEKVSNFYWLPSFFEPKVDIDSLENFSLDNSSYSESVSIYKPITISGKGIFNAKGKSVVIDSKASLTFKKDATFMNSNRDDNPFGKIHFNGDMIFDSGSYVCTHNSYEYMSGDNEMHKIKNNLIFRNGYKVGINPALRTFFPNVKEDYCQPECEFLISRNRYARYFNFKIDSLYIYPEINVKSLSKYPKWRCEIQSLDTSGRVEEQVSKIFYNETAKAIFLNKHLNHIDGTPFELKHCKEYKITLSIPCSTDTSDWVLIDFVKYNSMNKSELKMSYGFGSDGNIEYLDLYSKPKCEEGDKSKCYWKCHSGINIDKDGTLDVKNYPKELKAKSQKITYTYINEYGCEHSSSITIPPIISAK